MPTTPELADYITKARASGLSDDAIRTELLKAGWQIADVNTAIPPRIPVSPQPQPEQIPLAQPALTANRRSRAPFIITVAVLLILGGAVYYFLPQIVRVVMSLKSWPISPVSNIPSVEQNKNVVLPTDTPLDILKYVHRSGLYTLHYPNLWTYIEKPTGTSFGKIIDSKKEHHFGDRISILDVSAIIEAEGQTLVQEYLNNLKTKVHDLSSLPTAMIGGFPTQKFTTKGPTNTYTDSLFIIHLGLYEGRNLHLLITASVPSEDLVFQQQVDRVVETIVIDSTKATQFIQQYVRPITTPN